MPPGLQLARSKLLEPRVAQIGVYAESPPLATQLKMFMGDEQRKGLFDAIGPFLGVQVRRKMYEQMNMTYDLTEEDKTKVENFWHFFYLVFPESGEMVASHGSDALYHIIFNWTISIEFDRRGINEALYELYIYYIRYVWTYKLPEPHLFGRDAQIRAWKFLWTVFRYLERTYLSRLGRYPEELETMVEQPELIPIHPGRLMPIHPLHDGYTEWSHTPLVKFVGPNEPRPVDNRLGILYEMLTAYWSAQARLRWKKVVLVARMNMVWIACYKEVVCKMYKPGGQGAKRALEEYTECLVKSQALGP